VPLFTFGGLGLVILVKKLSLFTSLLGDLIARVLLSTSSIIKC